MLGSTKIDAERLAALAREVGSKRASRMFPNLLDYAEPRMRAQIANSRPGRYSGADMSDHDCFGEASVTVQVTLTVEGDRVA
jgi:N-methylhydantoinase B